jgi:aryl-alcohol dehydrogenase-like predicted oxidoreductase
MNNLIDRGLAFYWGTSEWSAQMLQEARDVANRLGLVPPFFDQTQYSMIHRERVEVECVLVVARTTNASILLPFLSNLYLKTIILPRQARDKHRKS